MNREVNLMGKSNFRQDVTNEIIKLMENNEAPWQKPWNPNKAAVSLEVPHNAITIRPYRGGNAIYLMAKGISLGGDPRWCTLKQANSQGWKIKKNSKATTVEYWQYEDIVKKKDPETGKEEKVKIKKDHPCVFYAKVFNASQIEGIPQYQPAVQPKWEPNVYAERILKNSGAAIHHDQVDRAFYSPAKDEIHLPPKAAFANEQGYYSTSLHELGHWTGHDSRLKRNLANHFGTEAYAKEELRAEMASLFVSMETGVPFDPSQHAAYTRSWISKLQGDRHEFFRASADAEKIADYVINLAIEKKITEEKKQNLPAHSLSLDSERQKRLEAIQNEAKHRTLPECYRSAFKNCLQENLSYDAIDKKLAATLLLDGRYTSSRIKDVIQKHSPAANVKGYGAALIKSIMTPSFKKELRNQQALSR